MVGRWLVAALLLAGCLVGCSLGAGLLLAGCWRVAGYALATGWLPGRVAAWLAGGCLSAWMAGGWRQAARRAANRASRAASSAAHGTTGTAANKAGSQQGSKQVEATNEAVSFSCMFSTWCLNNDGASKGATKTAEPYQFLTACMWSAAVWWCSASSNQRTNTLSACTGASFRLEPRNRLHLTWPLRQHTAATLYFPVAKLKGCSWPITAPCSFTTL